MSSAASRVTGRFHRVVPSARYGLASAVAVAGTGRLRRMTASAALPHLGAPDPYGLVAGLDAGLASLREVSPR